MNSSRNIYKNVIEILLLITLSVLFFLVPNGADVWVIWPCLILFYFYFFNAIKSPLVIWGGIQTYLKIDVLLLLFYYLLFYMPYQAYVLGLSNLKENNFLENTYAEYTNSSLIACTIGLIAFMLAFNGSSKIKLNKNLKLFYSRLQYLNLYVILLLILMVLGVLFYFFGFAQFLSDEYSGSDTGNSTTDGIYFLLVLFFSIISALTILYYRIYKKVNTAMVIFLVVCALFCVLLLISGDRNSFFLIATVLCAGYYTYIKSISRVRIMVYIFAALFIYQVIEVSRTSDKRSIGAIIDAVANPDSNQGSTDHDLDRSSFTITTIATRYSFFLVPERHDFFWGKFKLVGLGGVVPYSRGLYVSKNDHFTTSAEYVSNSMGLTWSIGSSIIADCYLDFGIPGIIILMYLLGRIGAYIQTKAQENQTSVKWGVIYLLTLSTYAEVSRYSFDFIVRSIVWTIMIFALFEYFSAPSQKPRLIPVTE